MIRARAITLLLGAGLLGGCAGDPPAADDTLKVQVRVEGAAAHTASCAPDDHAPACRRQTVTLACGPDERRAACRQLRAFLALAPEAQDSRSRTCTKDLPRWTLTVDGSHGVRPVHVETADNCRAAQDLAATAQAAGSAKRP